MHKIPFLHARRIFAGAAAALILLLLSGCELTVTNLTPDTVPENPSQIYTISMRVQSDGTGIVKDSIQPRIIVDGQSHPMQKSALGADLFEFDYALPAGHDEAAYYFVVSYQLSHGGVLSTRESYTDVFKFKPSRRYVHSLDANRGPVGARISLVGRGFTPQDIVFLDGTPARTVYESPSSLSFFVPAVESGRNYKVALGSAPVGTFRVDPTTLSVAPGGLTLRSGETQALTFTLPNPAPSGGLLLDLTTDIPESVIMAEVNIPEGQTSVIIPVQGGKAGTGALYLKGYGDVELCIPVTVK